MQSLIQKQIHIEVSEQAIDLNTWQTWLETDAQDGAVATFIGKVRQDESNLQALVLEHYPIMTEQSLQAIAQTAQERFLLNRIVLIHRVGSILLNERIVFVGVSAAHRNAAFDGIQFIMDLLKNKAPFWKKEQTSVSTKWVEAKKTDQEQLKKWHSVKNKL